MAPFQLAFVGGILVLRYVVTPAAKDCYMLCARRMQRPLWKAGPKVRCRTSSSLATRGGLARLVVFLLGTGVGFSREGSGRFSSTWSVLQSWSYAFRTALSALLALFSSRKRLGVDAFLQHAGGGDTGLACALALVGPLRAHPSRAEHSGKPNALQDQEAAPASCDGSGGAALA